MYGELWDKYKSRKRHSLLLWSGVHPNQLGIAARVGSSLVIA